MIRLSGYEMRPTGDCMPVDAWYKGLTVLCDLKDDWNIIYADRSIITLHNLTAEQFQTYGLRKFWTCQGRSDDCTTC